MYHLQNVHRKTNHTQVLQSFAAPSARYNRSLWFLVDSTVFDIVHHYVFERFVIVVDMINSKYEDVRASQLFGGLMISQCITPCCFGW